MISWNFDLCSPAKKGLNMVRAPKLWNQVSLPHKFLQKKDWFVQSRKPETWSLISGNQRKNYNPIQHDILLLQVKVLQIPLLMGFIQFNNFTSKKQNGLICVRFWDTCFLWGCFEDYCCRDRLFGLKLICKHVNSQQKKTRVSPTRSRDRRDYSWMRAGRQQ